MEMITVLGPTATGKTSFAAHLAKLTGGEIISADSRQVYRGMDLGTGKDLADYQVHGYPVPFHLIDILEAGEKYNVFEYQTDFKEVYECIKKRNNIPILCGGSGMYIESVLKGYKLIHVPVNELLREQLGTKTHEELTRLLSELKPLHNKSDVDTTKRAIRAIEIETYYQIHPETDVEFPAIPSLIFGINFDRKTVKNRINQRLKQRLRDGMIDEVQQLLDKGIPPEVLMYYGLEYKLITRFLLKEFSYNTMVEKLMVAIHQFSKRQMTWFRKMERDGFAIHWIDGYLPMEEKLIVAMNLIKKNT